MTGRGTLLTTACLVVFVARAWADPPGPGSAPTPPDDAAPNDDMVREVMARNAAVTNEPTQAAPEPITGVVRFGAYADNDQTTVLRALATVGHAWSNWTFGGSFDADVVTSASVDVRSSPTLSKVDTVTTASGRSSTSGGQMTDRRYQGTGTGGWKDSAGHAVNVTAAVAKETDYASVSGGLNGSYDILDRTATLLGGVTVTDNWISSVIDPSIHRKMLALAWSAGVARVLTPDDAIRVRYDGKIDLGYNSSPYRNVRFGDWTAELGAHAITFANTLGSADGLIEHTPATRHGHAVVTEWVHSLSPGIGLHPEVRLAHDSWGISSVTAGLDLRIARPTWRLETGYRFYLQSRANFFEGKYVLDPSMYTYYTSDKELGEQVGHLVKLAVSRVLMAHGPTDARLLLNVQLDAIHYSYPGFTLLPSRDSAFGLVGVSLER